MKKRTSLLVIMAMLLVASTMVSGCGPSMGGTVKDDVTLSGAGDELEQQLSGISDYRGPKLRIGIVKFVNKTPSKTFGIGESATDMLATILGKTNRFIVIASQDMEAIASQQAFNASGMVNPATAARMGQVLGLNAIITGAITAYSEAVEGKDYAVFQSKKQIARVTVDYRVVDLETGVQLLADSGAGIYEKSTSAVLGMGSKTSYDTTLRDGALRDALVKATLNIVKRMEKRKWSGRIASVKGSQIYVNAGAKSGINVGDTLLVYRPGDDIIDPVTKMKIGTEESFIGEISILQNDLGNTGDLSLARGGSQFKAGDIVKMKGM